MILAVLGSPTRTNVLLAAEWRRLGMDARVLWPREALFVLAAADVAIVRLDVLPSLDGVEPGLEHIPELEELGVRVLNRPDGLLATHDKLVTARRFDAAGIPHPRTEQLVPGDPLPDFPVPFVVKPRFGSWGQDVFLCRTAAEAAQTLNTIADRPWWQRHGALLQELVGVGRVDLRLVVAGDRAVAGAERRAAPEEWRTNATLGGTIVRAELPPETKALAVRAANAIGVDFAGVDLLPTESGWMVLELNGAVDFDARYAWAELDPYAAILAALDIATPAAPPGPGKLSSTNEMEAVMAKTAHGRPAEAGDEILITGHSVGDSPRTALILEVLGEPGHERFRVRWEDGHESIFFPGEDAVVHRPAKQRAKKTA